MTPITTTTAVFYLNENQVKLFNQWMNKSLTTDEWKDVEIVFDCNSGIGTAVEARTGNKKIDLTDYGDW